MQEGQPKLGVLHQRWSCGDEAEVFYRKHHQYVFEFEEKLLT